MDKRFWAIIGIIVVIFVGVFYLTNARNNDEQNGGNAATLSSHFKGGDEAKVTLVEYGDYQCPVCANYYPVIEQVLAKYGDQVKFQYRNFPLTSIHDKAFLAARAAEAAGIQDKYWEMYGLLYQNQQAWSARGANASSFFENYARQIGLDVEKFKQDAASSRVNDIIRADSAEADRLKLESTPSFFLNGEAITLTKLVDDRSRQPTVDKFSELIDQKLRQAGVTPTEEPAAEPAPAP